MLFAVTIMFAALLLSGCSSTGKSKNLAEETVPTTTKPETSEPILGVGDTIDIVVYRNDDLKKIIKIDKSGKIMFPLIGDVQVAERTVYNVRDELQTRLAKYIVNPHVIINITGTQSQKVLVLGEVKNPGMLTLDVDFVITDAIAKMGGPTNDAKTSDVYVIRRAVAKQEASGKPELLRFDMKGAFRSGDFKDNVLLKNGDIVYVPPTAMTDVARFMSKVGAIIGPVVTTETGIILWPQSIDVLNGKKSSTSFSVPTP